jgi:hypothetical protein
MLGFLGLALPALRCDNFQRQIFAAKMLNTLQNSDSFREWAQSSRPLLQIIQTSAPDEVLNYVRPTIGIISKACQIFVDEIREVANLVATVDASQSQIRASLFADALAGAGKSALEDYIRGLLDQSD